MSSCSATPRTPRISRSARAPSSRSKMRSSWPRCSTARASASKRRWTNMSPSGTSKCSSSRTARATRPNGSRRSTATSHFEPLQFAYSLLTRSQRISHENLRLRDREWLEGVERWFWKRATDGRSNKTAPPMFAPFKLREMEVENRITVSPMAMYSAVDGTPNDFHFVHYGERAIGGAGPRLHRDDLRLARRPDQPRLHRHVERRARRRVEAHRRFRPRQFARRRSASSSAIPAARVRPSSAGKATTSRSTTATGR